MAKQAAPPGNVRVRVRVNKGAFLLPPDDGSTRHVFMKCPGPRSFLPYL